MWTEITPAHQLIIAPDGNVERPKHAELLLLPDIERHITARLKAGCEFLEAGSCGCSACEPDGAGAELSPREFAVWQEAYLKGRQAERDSEGAVSTHYRQARGILPWQPGDELPEETIRRMRDGASPPPDYASRPAGTLLAAAAAALCDYDAIAAVCQYQKVVNGQHYTEHAAADRRAASLAGDCANTILSALTLLNDCQPAGARWLLIGLMRRLDAAPGWQGEQIADCANTIRAALELLGVGDGNNYVAAGELAQLLRRLDGKPAAADDQAGDDAEGPQGSSNEDLPCALLYGPDPARWCSECRK